jgi:hypothetical protein
MEWLRCRHVRQVRRFARHATPFEIGRRGTDNPFKLGEFLRVQRQFVDLTGADRDVFFGLSKRTLGRPNP